MRFNPSTMLAVVLSGISATAFAGTQVTINNQSGQRLCIALGETEVISTGTSLDIQGYDCVESEAQIVLDEFDGVRQLAMVDETGADFLVDRVVEFPASTMYVTSEAAETTEAFGLEVIELNNDMYSYSYAFGNDGYSNYRLVGDLEDLNFVLAARGFKKVTGRTFDSAGLPSAVTITIN